MMWMLWSRFGGLLDLEEILIVKQSKHVQISEYYVIFCSLIIHYNIISGAKSKKILHFKLSFENYCEEISLILQNLTFTVKWKELNLCVEEWDKFVMQGSKDLSKLNNNVLRIKAICDRIKNCLGTVIDNMTETLQPSATYLGTQFKLPTENIEIFTEEVIRGSLFFAVSMVMKKIDQFILQITGQSDWLVISPLEQCQGNLQFVQSLRTVQTVSYEEGTVLITEKVLGDEEIPENVKAVILVNSPTYPDVLSHVSVRARNCKALFCVCLNYEIGKQLFDYEDQYVQIKQKGQNIEFKKIQKSEYTETKSDPIEKQEVFIPKGELKEYFVQPSEFTKENVGAKSNNLEKIRGKIEPWIKLPKGMTIQFNAFEEILDLPENEAIQQQLEDQLRDIIQQNFTTSDQLNTRLQKCQSLVMQLNYPIEQKGQTLKSALESFGITDIKKAWTTIKRVFASKFNERAYISTKKIGITLDQIRMAVLIQPIVQAEYAFVIHTKNPITENDNELYCEVVKGLGETLVGAFKGQALSFVVDKKTLKGQINSFMSKSVLLKSSGYMFRSDSNTEDLQNFAGAGLFDSYPSEETITELSIYSSDKLMLDDNFQTQFMKQITSIALQIEKVYGTAQDIEGCYWKDEYYVVQTRPQV
eukprot:TRINITY_DN3133_c0_g1_i3.p1 TRINITY_DN3133_c0_g1~~TRINITY_DN3133_c0_g1_i3.p1  ORF type:complete len:644 (+),score=72.26 TRINITY_DN3133_c0_g1_i3:1109-3040(+)